MLQQALLPAGVVQTTQYVYGVSSTNINSNELLGSMIYPDNLRPHTEVFSYNALGEVISKGERNYNAGLQMPQTHGYSYDVLGRLTADAVTVLGDGVDGAIRRLETAYDTAGRPFLFTSYSAASAGTIVNQVQRGFNGLGQLTAEYQAHGSAVDPATTLRVRYNYSEMPGGLNHSRLVSMIYPDTQANPTGRQINYNYNGTTLDDSISRLTSLSDSTATLEQYSYLGLGTVVKRAHPQPGIDLIYVQQSGDTGTPDGGDQYSGLDRFGRVVDQRWIPPGSPQSPTDRFGYSYDRDSNRLSRTNVLNALFSEQYFRASGGYDPLNRLTDFSRGSHSQSWMLDAVGNWKQLTTDNSTPQNRGHNLQNQISSIDSGLVTPAYDNNGNTKQDETGKQFVFDGWNRLVQVNNSTGQPLASYTYDALAHRITESANSRAKDLYLSAAWQVLEERAAGTSNVQAQYVWSPVYS